MDLFEPDAPWSTGAAKVSVFKLYPYFVGRAPDDVLRKVFADLRRRGIKLALEARALSVSKGCRMVMGPNGVAVGDGGQNTINLLRRVKWLGGRVDILAMDEPVKHGAYGEPGCRTPARHLAEDVAANVRLFRAVFPEMKVGGIEPIGSWTVAPTFSDDVLSFVREYENVMGEKLAFLHADVGWRTDWLPAVTELGARVRAVGVPFGVIYNGEDLAPTDELWTSQAVRHFKTFEDCKRPVPDEVIFQTWRPRPTRVLPEGDPTTLAGVLKQYLERPRCKP